MKFLFVCAPSAAYGEINAAVALADEAAALGARIWFIVSPLGAELARPRYGDSTFELTPNKHVNQVKFWRILKKVRPDLIVFTELYEILQPNRMPSFPLIDTKLLQDLEYEQGSLIFLDFIAHAEMLTEIANCPECAGAWDGALASFFQRLWVLLPCPLNEPGPVDSRRGVPFRLNSLPVPIAPHERRMVRSSLLRDPDEILILRTGSTWQTKLAKERGVHLYDHLPKLLEYYLGNFPKPVTIVSVSSLYRFPLSTTARLRFVNFDNLPPGEFHRLMLSCDAVITDNEISYSLSKATGTLPGVVLNNSFTVEDVLRREGPGSFLSKLVGQLEREHPGSVYPFRIYPLAADEPFPVPQQEPVFHAVTERLGRMESSPYYRAELLGGDATKQFFEWLLLDRQARKIRMQQDEEYIRRLQKAKSGIEVFQRIADNDKFATHKLM
jgi:hypothetical protein